MTLNQEQRKRLVELGEELLAALGAVSDAAASQLRGASTTASVFQSEKANRNLFAIQTEVRQSLQRLRQEPMVARVLVEWQGADEAVEEVIYVCRASAAGLSSVLQSGRLASYRAPIGRLAELSVGDHEVFELPRGNEREAHILERATFQPLLDGDGWDTSNNDLAFRDWNRALVSLRRFIREIGRADLSVDGIELIERVLAKAAEEEIVRNSIRRQTIDRIALRDQAILDAHQGEIFRLPLNKRLVLLGPPGTGKTTTLIKRIAQKRTINELGDEERQLVDNLGLDPTDWVMYSPTELLKLYLRDAFNKEGVPAGPSNLRTWESERHELGRNVLGIFRGTTGGRYVITTDNEILRDSTSPSLSSLHDEFSGYMIKWVITRCEKALAQIRQLKDPEATVAVERIQGIIRSDSVLLNHVYTLARDRSLADEVRRLSQQATEKAHAMVGSHLDSEKLNALVALLPDLESRPPEVDDEDEDEEDDDLPSASGQTEIERQKRAIDMLRSAVRSQARATAQGTKLSAGSKASRVLECLGDSVPPEQDYAKLGRVLVVRDGLRRLHRSARDLVFRVPTAYARFRREAMKENCWYLDDIQSLLSNNRISPAEVDILILCMLRNARVVGDAVRDSPWLDVIRDRYTGHLYVDEATDFSAVELACMLELAHPKLRSWFACGDFRQRITWSGLTGRDELGWIQKQTGVSDIEKREIKRYYRQSPRLIVLATELAKIQGFEIEEMETPNNEFLNYAPLCVENLDDEALAKWLSGRIEEVERAVGHLPSIAIFVDGEERIDPLVARVGRYLQEHSLTIVGCKEGRVVGEAKEVRVFDVKHIKGLEFEAVFVVGIDHLAERLPDLFDRYLYVAVSRAATFLAVTNEGNLPQRLESVRSQFSTGTWHK